ncbi:MAG: hypothetical protein A3C02_02710 [Candidatus Andersenbacteria bacterium RIFCSPHIGHO2_02_FULL_45_11]|uniref:ATP-grasp domain-containing protein n=1 Tax=Candidatus Andersenbacteria bacterium RIFCSPHIGHO2_12_FULL_45_11 TaxID=1797281 RepID=A0A1G1X157_9BACT|nr:MAG: hypothetical protein A3C02_02710 [Candidatus Andersenbacteria bacterium RIFCSPHIGHO2_02_FULL_45_11]OGY33290.1 MAG: hypothetical protein A3D99_03100 [Candidatus Andersenbacteria bacterium RIFCSPHIGHO2_12_FULL_45_11]
MNLLEHEGKELFKKYGIRIPTAALAVGQNAPAVLVGKFPLILKSQVPVGDRGRKGGIAIANNKKEFAAALARIKKTRIDGHLPESLLIEQAIEYKNERYISFSFSTSTRTPVLAISAKGGSGTSKATIIPLKAGQVLPPYIARDAIAKAGLIPNPALVQMVVRLSKLFYTEKALLAEINPLFELADGTYIAGDAKVILDDAITRPDFRPYADLGGDIAILASGGGASMINLDTLIKAGGKPANYVEYSGNPKSDVVKELTQEVLSQKGLKGCWVVGGTANFTDIYETMVGFIEGLRLVKPRPTYPIVIRRDGPRQKEAFEMLEKVKKGEKFNLHLFGPETSMSDSAKEIIRLAYKKV